MPHVDTAISSYCDLFALPQGTEREKNSGVPLHSSRNHTRQGKLSSPSRKITQLHQILRHTGVLRGIRKCGRHILAIATLCTEETGHVGGKKKCVTECVTVSSALLPSNPSCSHTAACPLPPPPHPPALGQSSTNASV